MAGWDWEKPRGTVSALSEMDGLHIPAPLAVKVFPGEGRGLVAEEELSAGQEVIRSKAFASAVAAEVITRFCAFCAKPTK